MVFESYVVTILNKFLGQYVENLDPSQFQMSIWGGDVKLENLVLKENALDELDLPVKVLRGHLGQLILKIPWKNLYAEPVVAKVDGVFILARPNTNVKYNHEKEEKIKQEQKQQELTAIEEAVKYAEESKKKTKEDNEKSMGFAEKLAMHIVKNIQVFVSNIHIRYEDNVSNEDGPFSVGITLENLSAESVDENWQPVVIDSKQTLVNKLARLDNLALYLNSHDDIGEVPSIDNWVNIAKAGIARDTDGKNRPEHYNYVIEPLTSKTKATLDTNSVPNLSIPKIFVEIIMKEFGLVLSRHQFKDVMRLADNFDRMKTNSMYRKYKPEKPLKESPRTWWKYAIRAVLEEDVKRKARNWSWQHIVNHRMKCHQYKKLYKEKLSRKSISEKTETEIKLLEADLDVLNITIARKEAEIETKKEGTNYALNEQRKKEEGGGWFSGFFGKSKDKKTENAGLTKEEQQAEEQKLYAAIGYSESDSPAKLPVEYVAYKLKFEQKRISVNLRDDTVSPAVIVSSVNLEDLAMELGYRPGGQGLGLTAKMGHLNVLGTPNENEAPPEIIQSVSENTDVVDYINASVETNPLDGKCDQRVRLTVQPLQIIYHANTVESLMKFFKLPEDLQLSEISAAAYSQIGGLTSQSRANLSHAIETHTLLDIDVLIHSPFVLIPEKGALSEESALLVVDLGSLKVSSDPTQERITSTKALSAEELEEKCYDKFNIEMKQLQILMAKPGENWKSIRHEKKSKLHLLHPFGIDIQLQKSLAPDDVRLTQIRLSGALSSVELYVTDRKLEDLIQLALSIPVPGAEDSAGVPRPEETIVREVMTEAYVSPLNVASEREIKAIASEDDFQTPPESPTGSSSVDENMEAMKLAKASQTNVELKFEIKQISVVVATQDEFGVEADLLQVDLIKLGTHVAVRPHDLAVAANMGDILVKEMMHGINGAPLLLVSTPADVDIFDFKYVQASKDNPKFQESFNNTEQAIDVKFASLKVVLHQEALLNLIQFANNLAPESEEKIEVQQEDQLGAVPGETKEDRKKSSKELVSKKSQTTAEIINMKLDAQLGEFVVVVASKREKVAELHMKHLQVGLSMLPDRMTVMARMQDLSVMDGFADALYPKIVTIVNEEVFNVEVVVFNGATEGENYGNMDKVDTQFTMNVGRIRVIFLNRFVSNILAFVNNFQEAQEAITSASKTAAKSATLSLQEYNKNSPRVKLAVTIQAPLVIVPVHSRSNRALVADLGNLSVHNDFKVVNQGTGHDIAVVDTMLVSFTSLQVSVVLISPDETIAAQRLLLKPLSLELSLSRSLSSWYHEVPDIDLVGKLHAVNVDVGTDDIKTALSITSQNLAEGAQIAIDDKDTVSDVTVAVLEAEEESAEIESAEEKSWVAVKFAFSIEKVSASIYKNTTELNMDDESTWDHPAENCVGNFSMEHFAVSGSLLANNAMSVSVVLQTISLDDKRPALEKGITRMIERRHETAESETGSEAQPSNMIKVQFEQTKDQDKSITIFVKGFSVIVNLEFLLVLAGVFTSALEDAEPKPETESATSTDVTKVLSGGQPTTVPVSTSAASTYDLVVKFQVDEPEIILLADAKQKNTNALILKNTLDVSLRIKDEQMRFQTCIQDLSIVSAAFDKNRREATTANVLRMKVINLYLSSRVGGRQHIDLHTSVAYVNISPAAVSIASAVAASLAPAQEGDAASDDGDVPHLFEPVDINRSEKWYLKEVARGQLVPGSKVFARNKDKMNYVAALVTTMDQKLTTITEDGVSLIYDLNDVRGVVLDELPLVSDIVVGSKVIAFCKDGEPYRAGVILKILDTSDKNIPNVLVKFVKGEEEVKPFEQIRLLKSVKNGASKVKPVVSSVVWTLLPDKVHYAVGFISKKDWRYQVKFPNGTHLYQHLHDPLGLVLDRNPRPEQLQVGSYVIGCLPDEVLMFPGRVKKVLSESCEIQFDNGEVHENRINELRLLKVPKSDGSRLKVGCLLWIKYTDGKYYRGFVDAVDTKVHVKLYEREGKFSFGLNDHVGVVADVMPTEVVVGEEVIALQGTHGVPAIVTKMETSDKDTLFLLESNGSETWGTLKDMRRFGKASGSKGVSSDTSDEVDMAENREDQLLLDLQGFVFNVEAEKGGNLVSLITMRGNVHAEVKDWSEKLHGHADVQLEANYFNEELSEWEPLIEKLEDKDGLRPWELSIGFQMGQDSGSDMPDESESQMLLSVESTDVLELTVTKTNLEVFSELGRCFGEAVTESVRSTALEKTSPYEIKNEIGLDVHVRPSTIFENPSVLKNESVVVRAGESLSLWFANTDGKLRLASMSSDIRAIKIGVQVDGFHEVKDISVKEASCAFYNIIPKKIHKEGFRAMVVHVSSPGGRKVVVLRSPFTIKNHCPIPLELFTQKDKLELLTTLEKDSCLNVPLPMANDNIGFFLKPGGFPYENTVEEIRLNDMAKTKKKLFACAAPWPDADPFFIQVQCVGETYTSTSGSRTNQPCYSLHCYPPVVLHNYLPFSIQFSQENNETFVTLDGGNKLPIYTANLDSRPMLNLKLESYLGETYTGKIRLGRDLSQLSFVYLCAGNKKLLVSLYVKKGGSLEVTLYAKYWLINHTGLPLEYKPSDTEIVSQHPANESDVAIFAFTSKPEMFKKNTLKLRADGSEWSDKFSLDTAGSEGSLKCKKGGKEYGIGSEIRLSYFSLTKIVVFTPLNLLVNQTKHSISLCESDQPDVWYTAKPGETIPFWPQKTPARKLKIKTDDSPVESIPFNFQSNVNLLLRMDNGVGGLCVTMLSKDAATVMTFTPYFDGSAVLKLENDSAFDINYRQTGCEKIYTVPPKKTTVFTWDDPQGKRQVEWFVKGLETISAKSDLQQNDMGTLGGEDKLICHWASFLDGLQRVLYFTESYTMAFRAGQDQLEVPSQEITLSLRGIGISLVNNKKNVELAYMRITPSNVLWEEQKRRRRWKTMTTKCCDALETAWNELQNELARGAKPSYKRKAENMTVDFETMEIQGSTPRPIRRTFHPGVWVQFNQSMHEIQFHSKINDIQMDSQVAGSTFQTLFHSIPPPKTVAASNAPKPMIEASIITRKEDNAIVTRVKYFKVLVQELDVKMDKGWLLELVDLFGSDNQALDESNYEEDKKVVTTSLQSLNAAVVDVRNYYDYFHLSPLKVHISFSVQGGAVGQQSQIGGNVVDLLLNSLGVAVADVQDVVLKLGYFELKSQIYSQSQLTQVAMNHYQSQGTKQLYVLVLGLDVLGNPFGLIAGLTTGAKDLFYEPYQGLIQGPEEFAEGLALGVKSLFGHTIGGAAGAVSRITGTLGKGIAALTMDDEYQQSRRQNMSKKPTNVKEGLSRGGKGLLEGVFEGVTGVVTKPMEGAKKSGAKGFFKGMGKGLVGVVARPVGGVVDFASSTLEGIKGTASGDTSKGRIRPPRRFYPDKIMRPYNKYEAAGVELLKEYSKGKESLQKDDYRCHYLFPQNMAIVVTDKHILLMKKETLIKHEWENEWFCKIKDLVSDPKVNGTKVIFSTPEQGKMFKKTGTKHVDVKSDSVAEWIASVATEAKAAVK